MKLEDFFTLTEIKDGLTASDRVKELVNIMLKERDCVLKNASDATKHWSFVASTIAATEDKDSLNLFVQLDGISFINKWLEDAQKLGNEPSDRSAEEAITALLRAVEQLHMNYEQSVAYGIRVTVEKLFSHGCIGIKEKARALFDSWKEQGAGEAITSKVCEEDEGSIMKKHFEDSPCNEGEALPCCLDGNAPNRASTATVPKEDAMDFNQFSGNEVAIPSNRLVSMEISPSPMEKASESVTGSNLQTVTNIEVNNNPNKSATDDTRRNMPSKDKSLMVLDITPHNHSETMAVSQEQGEDCVTNVLEGSGNEDNSPKLHYNSGNEGEL